MAALFGPVRTLRARELLLGAALVALVSGQASFVLVHSFTATTSVSTNTFSICTNIYNANIKRVGAIKKLLHYELPKQMTHISNEAVIIKRFKIPDSSAVICIRNSGVPETTRETKYIKWRTFMIFVCL